MAQCDGPQTQPVAAPPAIGVSRPEEDAYPDHPKLDNPLPPRKGGRISRSVIPGLPRTQTFARRLSEERSRLHPVRPSGDERRAMSVDRRSRVFDTYSEARQADPIHHPNLADSYLPQPEDPEQPGQPGQPGQPEALEEPEAPEEPEEPEESEEPEQLEELEQPEASERPETSEAPEQPQASPASEVRGQPVAGWPLHVELNGDLGAAGEFLDSDQGDDDDDPIPDDKSAVSSQHEFDAMIRHELETTWILNLSMRYKDHSNREKFFVSYRAGSVWRRVTVTVDYRNAPRDSLETELLKMKYQRDKNSRIYENIRTSLQEIRFYDTVTNLKLETIADRLHVHVVEDGNEIIHFPPVAQVAHIPCPHIRESDIVFDHHMSGFVYKVKVAGEGLIKKEIPGPDTVDEFMYEINALSSLADSESVIDFYGLVVDDEDRHVKGLLIRYADGGSLVDILYDHCKDRRVGLQWSLKERWARQIVRGLADIHDAGFVQGDFTLSNIVIDDKDDAKIIDINRRGCPVGWEPPEATPLIESQYSIAMYIGVKSDLFQLGMVLWALAMGEDEPEREGRPLTFDPECEVPVWYRAMTDTCLSADPRKRREASGLLAFFPNEDVPELRVSVEEEDVASIPGYAYVDDDVDDDMMAGEDECNAYGIPRGRTNTQSYNWWQQGAACVPAVPPWHYAPRGRSPPSPLPSDCEDDGGDGYEGDGNDGEDGQSRRRRHSYPAWSANRNIRPSYSDAGGEEAAPFDQVAQQLTPSASKDMGPLLDSVDLEGTATSAYTDSQRAEQTPFSSLERDEAVMVPEADECLGPASSSGAEEDGVAAADMPSDAAPAEGAVQRTAEGEEAENDQASPRADAGHNATTPDSGSGGSPGESGESSQATASTAEGRDEPGEVSGVENADDRYEASRPDAAGPKEAGGIGDASAPGQQQGRADAGEVAPLPSDDNPASTTEEVEPAQADAEPTATGGASGARVEADTEAEEAEEAEECQVDGNVSRWEYAGSSSTHDATPRAPPSDGHSDVDFDHSLTGAGAMHVSIDYELLEKRGLDDDFQVIGRSEVATL
ncbi:STYKc [Geosmithia morbida]|uniref:STYKc n=1 Tax=Geosmithia morbida TaxID=1094350 RepID=A0A9P5D9J4_9HYPO|nr:STYKc [Geosmithia morbida]KAF4126589.1 STYKc [Geosmithia morbida]